GSSCLKSEPGPAPRFLVDGMLGKVARWLVLMGYDAAFAGEGEKDLELLERARREGRVFLTRDANIPEVAGLRKLVLRERAFEDQLARVLGEWGLPPAPARLSTRCPYCTLGLEEIPREAALPLVPPLVRQLQTPFFRCPQCRRMYWNGTHT